MKEKTENKGLNFLKQTFSSSASPINVCFTSRSSSGAWQIRGQQIAATRTNWEAINKPSYKDIEKFDLICFVKKPDHKLLQRVRKLGKPFVFDIVDSWAQPEDGLKYIDINSAREFFSAQWNNINADAYIFPTNRMRRDLGLLVKNGITIYHHHWPQLQKNPIRDKVKTVGYEGGEYLGEWRDIIENACKEREINFVVNPENYTDLDIVVMVRSGLHGSFLSKSYKSNVKLANAYGSGTPALVHVDEMSSHDTDSGDVLFFTNHPGSFQRQLDRLIESYDLRLSIHNNFLVMAQQFNITNIANQFEYLFINTVEKKRQNQ